MFCLTRRHDFVIYMYKSGSFFTNVEFHSEKQMAVLTKWNGQQLWPAGPYLEHSNFTFVRCCVLCFNPIFKEKYLSPIS